MTSVRAAVLRVFMALLLAFALWTFVSYTQNPDVTSSFEGVPVELEGMAPGMLVVDSDGQPRTGRATVALTVDADEDTLRNLTVSDLRAFVDMTGRGPGEHSVPVNIVPTRPGLQRARFSAAPDFLQIRLDQEITRTVPLSIELSGSVPFGFESGLPEAVVGGQSVETVTVRGPQGRVARVVRAQISADIDRLTANYNSPRTPEAVGEDGQVVSGVTIDPPIVNLEVPIVSSVGVKRVPVMPVLAGQPASGFIVSGVAVEPQLVTLTGSSGPLDAVERALTEALDVGEASQTFTRTVAIEEPLNTRLGFGEPTTAVVTVQIAPIARPFQVALPVPVQVVDIPPDLLVSLSPQVLQVTISGSSSQLAALQPGALVALVSARGLGEGTYSLAPTVQLPAGLRLTETPPVVTLTLRRPSTATPEASDTPEPGPAPTAQPGGTATPTPEEAATPAPEPTAAPTPTP